MPINFARKYLDELVSSIENLPFDKIEEIVGVLKEAYRKGSHVFIMGNGGSASTASHMVCDLAKGTHVKGKKRFKAIGLTDNVPLLTAWSNDVSYEDIFKAQLENLIETGDVVIVFTGSGNSPNILKAVKYANSAGAVTVGFTGFNGGKLKDLAQTALVVPSNSMQQVEDMHMLLEHLICLSVLEKLS